MKYMQRASTTAGSQEPRARGKRKDSALHKYGGPEA